MPTVPARFASPPIYFLAAAVAMSVFFMVVLAYRFASFGEVAPILFDDAFFFVRYAGNFLDTGVFAWNVGEGPVHGNTSQTYQVLVSLLHWITDRNAVLTLFLAATLGAAAYFLLLPLAYWAWRPMVDPRLRLSIGMLVFIFVALDRQVYALIETGMETTWALAIVALSLLLTFRVENGHDGKGAVLASAFAITLLYATRPDAVLIALAAPAGMVLFSSGPAARRHGLAICALALAGIGVLMLLCWIYYGDALPLAFATKLWGVSIWPQYGQENAAYNAPFFLWQTLSFHKVETLLAAVALGMFWRLSPAMRGAALGTMAFAAYYVAFVLPVMGHFGRLNAPIVPVLVLLSVRVIEEALSYAFDSKRASAGGIVRLAAGGTVALLVFYKVASIAYHTSEALAAVQEFPEAINRKEISMAYAANNMSFYEGRLDELVQALDEGCSIASTEHGILSAYAARSPIIDFSGLHDPRLVREGFSADRLLQQQRPDIVVMPPPWFDVWLADLEAHPALARDYVKEPGLSSNGPWLAFRRDSACAAKVHKALYDR